MVPKGTTLYYDPTPLQEATRTAIAAKDGTNESQQQNNSQLATPSSAQQPRPPYQTPQYGYPNVQSPMMAQQRSSGYPGTPMSAATPGGQPFYGDVMSTPTRAGHVPMDVTPDSRRITRGMSDYPGMYGS